ncbi:MAG: hypothetical protein DSY90_01025 [Deltaproteobacteria bacterium]|nr:MAG: hypothetical protein DSY90_01025 [Deltaproteobacteria bacterium]
MKLPYILFLGILTLILIIAFIFTCRKVRQGKAKIGSFVFVVMGMLIGMSGSFLIFFNIDTSKGWNPYGWWFLATFIATVLGGLSGLIIYGNIARKIPAA